ncbi:MAG: 1-acyl-sn-glycerol-3-phosphate acyltransferase [Clostridia bacterium]|nr:1-acyl-sn-glycerol-3-phosphate acyltransferase [Clostridia bacterium]
MFKDRAYIFVGNHLSVLDVVFPAVSTNRAVHYMAKSSLFEKGLMKKFVHKCECIPVNRDGTDVKAVMQAMKYLKMGESVVIFPEGTRNKTNETFLPFKSGATAISIKTKTPIIPMVQIKPIRIFRKAHVLFGEPIEFTEYYDKRLNEEDIKKCDDILLEKLSEMHQQLTSILSKKKKSGKV